MGILGAAILVFTVFIRPQEFVPGLASVGLLNLATGLGVLGIVAEFAMGRTKSAWSPQLPYFALFVIWCIVCTVKNVGLGEFGAVLNRMVILTALFLVVTYAARTYDRFVWMSTLIVAVSMAIAGVGVVQSQGEFECIMVQTNDQDTDKSGGTPMGRGCVSSPRECEEGMEPGSYPKGTEFLCEKPGPFGTTSIGHGRVRYLGMLADPNEMSLAIGAAFAFCFALFALIKSNVRHLLFGGTLLLAGYCIVQTASRGGVLVLLAVLGVYFVRRYGLKGALLGAALGLPVLMLGGRSGEEAESSTLERIGALYEGIEMLRGSPIFGVGQTEFPEHYFITAHNAYLLSAAELGIPGMFIWSLLVYVSVKISYSVAFLPYPGLDPRLRAFGMSLFVAFCGILVGITFLSFAYHHVLFIYLGMAGALFGAARQTCPTFDVKMKKRDFGLVAGIDAALLIFLFVYTRIKGAP